MAQDVTRVWWWVECDVCGYDSQEAGFLDKIRSDSICPLCAEDSGKSIKLTYRRATPEEIEKIRERQDAQRSR